MKLRSLTVEGFRGCRRETRFGFDGHLLVIGATGTGKTTLVQAIRWALTGSTQNELNVAAVGASTVKIVLELVDETGGVLRVTRAGSAWRPSLFVEHGTFAGSGYPAERYLRSVVWQPTRLARLRRVSFDRYLDTCAFPRQSPMPPRDIGGLIGEGSSATPLFGYAHSLHHEEGPMGGIARELGAQQMRRMVDQVGASFGRLIRALGVRPAYPKGRLIPSVPRVGDDPISVNAVLETPSGKERISPGQLSETQQRLFFLALETSLLLTIGGGLGFVCLDDPLQRLNPGEAQAVAEVIAEVSSARQVIATARSPADADALTNGFAQGGDASRPGGACLERLYLHPDLVP